MPESLYASCTEPDSSNNVLSSALNVGLRKGVVSIQWDNIFVLDPWRGAWKSPFILHRANNFK